MIFTDAEAGGYGGKTMKTLKNKEIQLAIGILAVLMTVFGAVTMYNVNGFAESVNTLQLRQNIGAVGAAVKKYPQAEAEIVRNFTVSFQGDYEYGKSILEKYGYNEQLSIGKNDFIKKDLNKIYLRFHVMTAAFALLTGIFFILSLDRIYSRIRNIGLSAEAVVEGNYAPVSGDMEEGDIGSLVYRFNSMAERLSETVQALKNEKLFLKRLITDISHQLKTPLASLVMFNDILQSDSSLPEQERAAFVAESKNQLDRMEWLIKNMLKMAKLEAGVVDFEKRYSYIGQTVGKSVAGLGRIAGEKGITLRVWGPDGIRVRHDVNWTAEAISNIIKNCIEHSSSGDEVKISWEENSVFVQIEILDNGEGIPGEELPRIFDRFYKGPNSRNPTNIGIGLYITKTIIEGQGGSVYVSSQQGAGTKFTVRLMKVG